MKKKQTPNYVNLEGPDGKLRSLPVNRKARRAYAKRTGAKMPVVYEPMRKEPK
jgi:hypothetical protein